MKKLDLDWLGSILLLAAVILAAVSFQLMTTGYQWEGFALAMITAIGFMIGHDYLMFR